MFHNLEKIKYQNEEHHFLLLNKIREKMVYTREDNPEIYELYDQGRKKKILYKKFIK